MALEFVRPSAYVFGILDGSARNPISVSQMFGRRVVKGRAALGSDELPIMTLHGRYHSHATILLMVGGEPECGARAPRPHDDHYDDGRLLAREPDDATLGG
ncbi:hypothetical protein [Rhodococcus sp. 077-4]|uniref:hypothetical protein n=1 Tax=Rhodococcus sp. 077-4 TaxID=2789271 RepID=UPI0039F55C85